MALDVDGIGADLYRAFANGDFDIVAAHYAGDAVLDAVVPHWRFQKNGRDSIAVEFNNAYTPPVRITEWNIEPLHDGVLIQLALHTGAGDAERFTRQAHILRFANGTIIEHRFYCSGMWTIDELEQNLKVEPAAAS